MKSDIERLMQENKVDALFITGPGRFNPAMNYMAGGIGVSHADLFVLPGREPILFHSPIEREGAAESGFELHSQAGIPLKPMLEETGGDSKLAHALRYREMFRSVGLTRGTVALYGDVDLGNAYRLIATLQKHLPDLKFASGSDQDVLRKARATKDETEIAHIRAVGEKTLRVVDEIADFLTSHAVRDEVMVKSDGEPLTIGDVKKRLRILLAEQDLRETGTIFAIGENATVPHNEGNPTDVLRLGQTIVFDAFFQEANGGYWHDFTRTWCLGYAPDREQHLFDQVKTVIERVEKAVEAGKPFGQYQQLTQDMFEEMGHPTLRTDPSTERGYVHGLGHGVGLEVHETPFAGANTSDNILQPGMVITIEPGLYYPEWGCAIRIEDTFVITAEGKAAPLVDYPRDLVLPV